MTDVDKSKWGPKAWSPATDEEYRAMSLPDKIREHTILATQYALEAGPQKRAAELMPEWWRDLLAKSADHSAEVSKLRKIVNDQREKRTAPRPKREDLFTPFDDAEQIPRAPIPPTHGALAPGRHITAELVALCERQGMVLPPPAEVEMESEAL